MPGFNLKVDPDWCIFLTTKKIELSFNFFLFLTHLKIGLAIKVLSPSRNLVKRKEKKEMSQKKNKDKHMNWWQMGSLRKTYWKSLTESLFISLVIGWKTTSHGLLSTHLPYHHTCMCAYILQTNRPLFPFDTNDLTQNFNCWQSRLRVSTLHTRTVILWETLCTWGPKILLQAFGFVQTSHQTYMKLKELFPRQML